MKNIYTLLFSLLALSCFGQKSNYFITTDLQVWQNFAEVDPGYYYGEEDQSSKYKKGVSQTAAVLFGIEQNNNFRLHAGFSVSQSHFSPNVEMAGNAYAIGLVIDINESYYLGANTLLDELHIISLEIPVGFDIRVLGKNKLKLWTTWQLSPTFITKRKVHTKGYASNVETGEWGVNDSFIIEDKKLEVGGGYIHTGLRLEYSMNNNVRFHLTPQIALFEHRDTDFFKPNGLGETYDSTFDTSTLFAKNWGIGFGVSRVF